jgi:hypothetical protein
MMRTPTSFSHFLFLQCSGKTDGLGISAVAFSEDPVVPGSTLTIKVDATPTVDITDGATLTFDILLGPITISSVEKDVCSDLGVTCPLPAGKSQSISVDVDVSVSLIGRGFGGGSSMSDAH